MPKGMNPRERRQSVETRLNDVLDRAMSLITALDLMEADCDLEETADDEPSLGFWPAASRLRAFSLLSHRVSTPSCGTHTW